MTSPAEDIQSILDDAGIGTSGTDMFVPFLPDSPDFCIAIADTKGFDANPAYLRDEPTLQIMVRSTPYDYATAWAKGLEIKNNLLGKDVTVESLKSYTHFWMMGDLTHIGMDESNRHLIVSNWHLVVEVPSGGNRISL